MRTIHYLLTTFFITAFLFSADSQITGTVTDSNGEPLPFASVYIEGSSQGTTTNEKGVFQLSLPPGKYQLVFQYVGYETLRREVEVGTAPLRIDVSLQPHAIQLTEVEVRAHAEDPAYPIIRRAIEKRPYYRNQLQGFSADVYVKGLIKLLDVPHSFMGIEIGDMGGFLDSTRQGIIYLSESVSKYHYRAPNEYKEVMVSSKVAGNDSGFSFNSATDMELNLYDNLLTLGRAIVSPIAAGAMNYYRYHLHGSFFDKGRMVYKIEVIPKNSTGPVLGGFVYINDGLWNIHSCDLYVLGESMLQPAIDTMYIRQTHVEIAPPDVWRIFSQTLTFTGKLMSFKFGGTFTAIYRNYVLNPDFPPGFFNNQVMKVEADANSRDSTYWAAARPIPLTEEEKRDYVKKDSLQAIHNSKEYLDSVDQVQNRFKFSNTFFGYTRRNSYRQSEWRFDSPLNMVKYNLVQGFALTAASTVVKWYEKPMRRRLEAGVNLSYGLSEKKLRADLQWEWLYDRKKQGTLRLALGKKLSQFNHEEPISELLAAYYMLFVRRNYLRLYERRFLSAGWQQELNNGLWLDIEGAWDQRNTVQNHADFSLFHRKSREFDANLPGLLGPNSPALRGNSLLRWSATVRLRPGQRYIDYPHFKIRLDTKWPELTLRYDLGLVTKGPGQDWQRLSASISKTDIHLGTIGRSSFYFQAGTFLQADSSMFFADYQHFPGNQTNFILDGQFLDGFRALPYYHYSTTDSWVRAHWEHNFDGFLLDKVPLIRRAGLSLVANAAWLHTPQLDSYTELTVGIDRLGFGIARVLRFDLTASFLEGKYQGLSWLIGIKIAGGNLEL